MKSYSMLREQAYDAIGAILSRQEGEEMDLYDCGVIVDVVNSEDVTERHEVIGVSRDEDGEISVHIHTTYIADLDLYSDRLIGELDFHELVDVLRAMEDNDENDQNR